MSFVVDSDVFLHDILHTERAEEARDFIDKNMGEISTTVLNIMEIGSVLSRKYRWKKEEIEEALKMIRKTLTIVIPTEYDMMEAMRISMKYYLTPIDAIMLETSRKVGGVLVTFDRELLGFAEKGFDVKSPKDIM